MLGAEADRVGLQRLHRPVRADDLVLVGLAFADAGQEDLPDTRAAAPPHRMPPPVPAVEAAHDRDAPRIGRPDREMRALHALMLPSHARRARPRAAVMRALADQVFVQISPRTGPKR
jgi:hypothetical protein